MNKKVITISIFILTVLVLGFGVIFLNNVELDKKAQTPSQQVNQLPTAPIITSYPSSVDATWETYTNTKYGYSIQHPPGWTTQVNVLGPQTKYEKLENATSLDIFDGTSTNGYPNGVITVLFAATKGDISEELVKSDVDLGGVKSVKYKGKDGELNIESYFIPLKNGFLRVDTKYSDDNPIRKSFDAIFASFKITG